MATEDMLMALLMAMDTGVVIIMARGLPKLILRLMLTMVHMVMGDMHMVSQEGTLTCPALILMDMDMGVNVNTFESCDLVMSCASSASTN